MPSREKLQDFVAWCAKHISGDEKGQAQVFLDRLFQAFGQSGSLDAGGTAEFRVRKSNEDGGGTAFADFVWKPVVLVEMKKRGENLQKHYRQAFDYWTRLVPNRPRYVVLCNFDEFRVYDFDTDLDTTSMSLSPGFQTRNRAGKVFGRTNGRCLFKKETFEGDGCHSVEWQQRNRTQIGVYLSQQRNQRLATTPTTARQARFCFPTPTPRRVCGRLLLAWVPQTRSKSCRQSQLLALKTQAQQTKRSCCFENAAKRRLACSSLLVARPEASLLSR